MLGHQRNSTEKAGFPMWSGCTLGSQEVLEVAIKVTPTMSDVDEMIQMVGVI